jgi:hypothetical protein
MTGAMKTLAMRRRTERCRLAAHKAGVGDDNNQRRAARNVVEP